MNKKAGMKEVVLFSVADFSKGIFTGMIANYLLYFLMPTTKSGIEAVISQGYIIGFITLIGLIKAVGHVFDAVTDPIIASLSDRCKSKLGRRVPFMRWAAIPYGLSALLIFCPPTSGVSLVNNIWVSACILLYYLFYTLYTIPHNALLPELIPDNKKRVTAYSISSVAFVTGSALVYTAPLMASGFKGMGFNANTSYQLTFLILTVIGISLLLVTAFGLKEKDFVHSKIPTQSFLKSLKDAFSNKEFCVVTAGQLFETTSMAFFQFSIMYYITELLGLNESQATPILIISIVMSVAMYPIIVKLAKRFGNKRILITALSWFIVSYLIIYFIADVTTIFGMEFAPFVKGVFFACFVAFPFGALNILPSSMMSDVIQYDTIKSGLNREGIFSATRSFITKIGQSVAVIVAASVVKIGAAAGENIGFEGIKMTAIIAAGLCLVSVIIFIFYNNNKIIRYVESGGKSEE